MEEETCLSVVAFILFTFPRNISAETKTFFKDFILKTSITAANRNLKLQSLIRAFGFSFGPS